MNETCYRGKEIEQDKKVFDKNDLKILKVISTKWIAKYHERIRFNISLYL